MVSTAPTAAPANMDTNEMSRCDAFGLEPPASDESEANPVSVVVSTVVVMSATPRRRTAVFRAPMLRARSVMTVKRGQPDASPDG